MEREHKPEGNRCIFPTGSVRKSCNEKRRSQPSEFITARKKYRGEREKQESDQFEKPPNEWPSPTRVGIDAPRGERKRKKLQEEKSVKNTSSTCSIIRKMPQKPTESDLKIWYSSISQNVRKLEDRRRPQRRAARELALADAPRVGTHPYA